MTMSRFLKTKVTLFLPEMTQYVTFLGFGYSNRDADDGGMTISLSIYKYVVELKMF